MVCECGKVLSVKQVCSTLLIISGVAQAWPYRSRFVFSDVEVFSWPSDYISFAEPRDASSSGSYGGPVDFERRKTDPKVSQGFLKVVNSAAKPPRQKHTNTKADKVIIAPVNKTVKVSEGINEAEVIRPQDGMARLKEDVVLFPDDVEMITSEKPHQRERHESLVQFNVKPCAGDVLCGDLSDSTEDYPVEAVVRSVQANFEAIKEFFRSEGDVSLQESAVIGVRKAVPDIDEKPLCTAESITRYPRTAKTANDKWLLVVNHENYTQGVKIEKCQNENSECYLGETLAPLGYKSVCRQKYAYRKLLAITPEGKTIAETFTIPSCCSCHVKRVPATLALRTQLKSSARQEPSREELSTHSPKQV